MLDADLLMSAPLQPARVTNEPSTLLRYSATLFELCGAGAFAGIVGALTGMAIGTWSPVPTSTLLLTALAGFSFLWTGRGLRARSRDSAIGAVLTFASPLAVGYVTKGLLSLGTFAVATVSIAILWAVWDELD